MSEQSGWRANLEAGRLERILQPRKRSPSEAVEGIMLKRRPIRLLGKANVLQEETVKSTVEAAGVGVLASG